MSEGGSCLTDDARSPQLKTHQEAGPRFAGLKAAGRRPRRARVRVRPGDGVPVDGEVLEGKGAVDESMVTGESMPAAKNPGDKLIGGTVNGTGSLVMRADKVGADTMLARMTRAVSYTHLTLPTILRV